MLDCFQYLKQHFLFKYGKLPSRAKQLQENEFTLLLVLHTYLYIVIIWRSEEDTSELQSLREISYAVFCLKKKNSKALGMPH